MELFKKAFLIFALVNSTYASFQDKLHKVVPEYVKGEKCWTYQHLPKAGGTTIIKMLQKTWGDRLSLYGCGHWSKGESFLRYFSNRFVEQFDRGTKNVMVGAYTEALRRSDVFNNKCQTFTVFRDPISRLVSAYFYCKYRGTDSLCAKEIMNANDVDLMTFAKHWGNFNMRSFIFSSVSYDDVEEYSEDNGILPDAKSWYKYKRYMEDPYTMNGLSETEYMYEMLPSVKSMLKENYIVGILEDFNTTMSLFDKTLDMPVLNWEKEYSIQGLANGNREKFADSKEATLHKVYNDIEYNTELKKYMEVDIMLYEYSVELFNEQVNMYDL